jgi:hypothetical protein
VLVSKHSQHASLQFVVRFLKPVSLELNFLLGMGFVLGAGGMNRFLGGNEHVVISLNTIDRIVKSVQVRLKKDFYSEGLIHQTLNTSTRYVGSLLSYFLVAVYFLKVCCDLLLDQKNFCLPIFN